MVSHSLYTRTRCSQHRLCNSPCSNWIWQLNASALLPIVIRITVTTQSNSLPKTTFWTHLSCEEAVWSSVYVMSALTLTILYIKGITYRILNRYFDFIHTRYYQLLPHSRTSRLHCVIDPTLRGIPFPRRPSLDKTAAVGQPVSNWLMPSVKRLSN